MIAASILFILPKDTDWNSIRTVALQRATEYYQGLEGLRTKIFVLNEETGEYGGLYVWENKEALETFLNSELFAGSKQKFGEPIIHTFEIAALIEESKLKELY